MFDPTIFENLKVIVEGAVYDLDFAGRVLVTGRKDRVELSTMSRTYAIQFKEQAYGDVLAEIRLQAGAADLAAEILELDTMTPGCRISVIFRAETHHPETECAAIEEMLKEVWGDTYVTVQTLSFIYKEISNHYRNEIEIDFGHKINEDAAGDIPNLLDHAVLSLHRLNRFRR